MNEQQYRELASALGSTIANQVAEILGTEDAPQPVMQYLPPGYEIARPLAEGDRVRLIGARGPHMIVKMVHPHSAEVIWFDGNDRLQTAMLPKAILVPSPITNPKAYSLQPTA